MTGPSAKAEQRERREIIRNEKLRPGDQPATTFHALANLDTSPGGRFAAGGYVSGSEQVVSYPAASGPWADPVRVPDEPLIDATDCGVTVVEAVGNAHEVEASLAQSVAAPAASSGSQSTEVHLLPSSDGERKVVAGLSNESGDPATTSIEERLAQILPKIAVPRPAPPKRRKV